MIGETIIDPSTLHLRDDLRLIDLANLLRGERLISARYLLPSGMGWGGGGDLDHVHEVDMGVELLTESGIRLELSWSTPGVGEGLVIAFGAVMDCSEGQRLSSVDVSRDDQWSAILGYSVESVAIAFCFHDFTSSMRPWSFRLGLSGSSSVTIALGEIREGRLQYMPDNIVVIFDEATAQLYVVPNSPESAWGEVIGR